MIIISNYHYLFLVTFAIPAFSQHIMMWTMFLCIVGRRFKSDYFHDASNTKIHAAKIQHVQAITFVLLCCYYLRPPCKCYLHQITSFFLTSLKFAYRAQRTLRYVGNVFWELRGTFRSCIKVMEVMTIIDASLWESEHS